MTENLTRENIYYKKYTRHGVDAFIVKALQSLDK
jgi:hypothetical protein